MSNKFLNLEGLTTLVNTVKLKLTEWSSNFSNYYTKAESDTLLEGKLNLDAVLSLANKIDYNSLTKKIYLKHNNTILSQIDASLFIKDGMVKNVKIQNNKLIISFNTDSGKENIEIPISSIFNASNYYTKLDIDNAGYLTIETDPTVPNWAKSNTKPSYSYSEITGTPTIPSKVSDLTNDSGFVNIPYVHLDGKKTTFNTNDTLTGNGNNISLTEGQLMLVRISSSPDATGLTLYINIDQAHNYPATSNKTVKHLSSSSGQAAVNCGELPLYTQLLLRYSNSMWIIVGSGTLPQDLSNYATTSTVNTAITNNCPIIEDTRNGNTASITGNATFSTLTNGQTIRLHLKYYTPTDSTLNLTLNDGVTTTGAKYIKTQSTKSKTMLDNIDNDYCKYVSGQYLSMVFNSTLDAWVCLSPVDTNLGLDSVPVYNSDNAVKSGGVFEKLMFKQNIRLTLYSDVSITLSGSIYDVDDFMDNYVTIHNNSIITTNPIRMFLYDLEDNSGSPTTKTFTYDDCNVLLNALIDADIEGETIPNIDSMIAVPILNADRYILIPDYVNGITPTLPTYLSLPDYTPADEFIFSFTCSDNNYSLTLPTGVEWADNMDFDADKEAGVKFQVSIQDGIAAYLCVTPSNSLL